MSSENFSEKYAGKFTLASVKEKLDELGVSPKKNLGQNFLINPQAIHKIVEAVKLEKPSFLIEIGPGLGALTEPLLQLGVGIKLIELDKNFCQMWRSRSIDVMEHDALRVDWRGLKLPARTVLVSNLPYQISASLVIDRSVDPAGIYAMVLMFQKEVAQRIIAKADTSDYGLITVISQNFWKVEHVLEISSKDFFPPPQVASRVVKFTRLSSELAQPEKFLKFVKAGFSQRRKFFIKNISSVLNANGLKQIDSIMAERNWQKVRAENLTPQEFRELYIRLSQEHLLL